VPVSRPAGDDYHLTEDLARRAAAWLQEQHAIRPERPFFVYLATGATHAPIHAPEAAIARFKGQFDHGWDEQRKLTFEKQKAMGIVPADTQLTPRPEALPAWDSLSADERRVASRLMEANAAFLAQADLQVGRVVRALEEIDALENTLFVYIVGDNGASAEGGVLGSWNYFAGIHGIPENTARDLERLDEIGGAKSYPHYPAGYAWAMNTPFQWAKTIASHLGGTRNPLVIHWPKGMRTRGALRTPFAHVNDLMPTILDAIVRSEPALAAKTPALPFDGTSLVETFDDPKAKGHHRTQYFEVFGHRAIYHDGWMASAFRGRAPWRVLDPITRPLEADRWELYDLDHDFSQANDLAAKEPERLRALTALFEAEAARNQVLPIGQDVPGAGLPKLHQDRRHFVFHEGAVGIPESGAPPIPNRSYEIRARIGIPREDVAGVIVTEGGGVAGWALYVDRERRPVYTYNFFDETRMTIVGTEPLPLGPVELRYVFDAAKGIGQGGRGRLYVGGKRVGEAKIARSVPRFFSIDETFDVGTDTGSPAGDYPAGWTFSGGIERVEVSIED
jgi:arylsulfatase A-like enzyme